MAEHFDAMTAGTHAIGNLPSRTCCKDDDATARIYEDEPRQVCQKILRCLDMRVMDGDLVVPTCLRTPTLILPAGCFVKMYYDLDAQGQYASQFPTGGQGFMQPREILVHPLCPGAFASFLPMCERLLTNTSIEKSWREGRTLMRRSA